MNSFGDMVSYMQQFKHKNNQKASLIECAERSWMLYVPMWRDQHRRVKVQPN